MADWFDQNAPSGDFVQPPVRQPGYGGGSIGMPSGAGTYEEVPGANDGIIWQQQADGSWTSSGGFGGHGAGTLPPGQNPWGPGPRPNPPGAPQGNPGMPPNWGNYNPGQQPNPAGGQSQGGGPPQVDPHDPQSVAAYVAYYAQQPGANPSLARDPNYWIQKITSGEFGTDPGYYVSKFMQPEGAPAGMGGGQNGLNGPWGASPFSFQYDPSSVDAQYLQGAAGAAGHFGFQFDPNSPDAQFIKSEAMKAAGQQFAARGVTNTGYALKELQNRAAGLASTDLQNQFNRQYQANALNFNQLQGVAALGQTGVQNQFNRQYQTSGLNFNQGLAANQNQFGQNYSLATLGLNAVNNGGGLPGGTNSSYPPPTPPSGTPTPPPRRIFTNGSR